MNKHITRYCVGMLPLIPWVALAGTLAAPAPANAACATKIVVAQDGVALSSFPFRNHLTRSITVGRNGGESAACWTAKSDASWLAVAPSAPTGTTVVLSANTAGLTKNAAHFAHVTILPAGSTTGGAKIRVSLWVGSADSGTVEWTQAVAAVVANPVDPLAYVSDGSSSIRVFNVYSGKLVKTFPLVAPTVGQLVVSSNGTTLFAVDTTNYKIVALSAQNGKFIRSYSLAGPITSDFSFAYARPAGVPTLFAPGQVAFNVATGAAASSATVGGTTFYDPLIAATPDGSRLAVLERGLSPGSIYTYSVAGPAKNLAMSLLRSTSIKGENCQAMGITVDGSRLYPACGWPYEFDVYDGSSLAQVQTLPAVPYPDNAVVDSDGNFVGGVNGLYEANDVFVFNTQGYSLGTVPTTTASNNQGQGSNQLTVSGDSMRVISATGAPYGAQVLMFRSLP